MGSPPRMRGQAPLPECFLRFARITPADAGTSPLSERPRHRCWDHPRGCGDKSKSTASIMLRTGSPPRMRGQVFVGLLLLVSPGITPADAGTRVCWRGKMVTSGDHPRGCGDKQPVPGELPPELGSPPRMRGQALGPKMG